MPLSATTSSSEHAKKQIVSAFLSEAGTSGWNDISLEKACNSIDCDYSYARALFPEGAAEIADYYLEMINRQMLLELGKYNLPAMKIRERIKCALMIRLKIAEPHKEAIRSLLGHLGMHAPKAVANLAKLSDIVWRTAGDTSTDYNYYTKRMMLSGVYSATLLFWLNDTSKNHSETEQFLDRRINNVMQVEKAKKTAIDLFDAAEKKIRRYL
ncbi:MAG: COQ9 family protein [Proteobacteria bacterium]|nr:COQ9 family protein [Pseudomonadota bacterium]